MSDLGSKTALQADCDSKVTTNGANENTGARVRAFLTNVIDTLYGNFQESAGNVATASTVDLGAQKSKVTLTGTTTVTSFGTADVGVTRTCVAAGVFQITHHNTNLIIPGGANVTTAVEDVFVAVSHGSGNWQIIEYTRRSGATLVAQTKASVGLGNVDNTSDAAKPVSTATQTALDLKASMKVYRVQLSDLGSDPIVVDNETHQFAPTTFAWARDAEGVFTVTASTAVFTANKWAVLSVFLSTDVNGLLHWNANSGSTTTVTVKMFDNTGTLFNPASPVCIVLGVFTT